MWKKMWNECVQKQSFLFVGIAQSFTFAVRILINASDLQKTSQ